MIVEGYYVEGDGFEVWVRFGSDVRYLRFIGYSLVLWL